MAAEPLDLVNAQLRSELLAAFESVVDRLIRQAVHARNWDRDSWVEDNALLDDEQTCRLLGVTAFKLADLREEGLPHLFLGRRLRYDRHALLEWISKRIVSGEGRP